MAHWREDRDLLVRLREELAALDGVTASFEERLRPLRLHHSPEQLEGLIERGEPELQTYLFFRDVGGIRHICLVDGEGLLIEKIKQKAPLDEVEKSRAVVLLQKLRRETGPPPSST